MDLDYRKVKESLSVRLLCVLRNVCRAQGGFSQRGLEGGKVADFMYMALVTSLVRKSNKIRTTERILVRNIIQLKANSLRNKAFKK